LKLCVAHPDLAYGKPPDDQRETSEWFAAHFLWAAEELVEYDRAEKSLKLHLSCHAEFLRTDRRFLQEDFFGYSSRLQAFVRNNVTAFGAAADSLER
jgi:hypothetical protein